MLPCRNILVTMLALYLIINLNILKTVHTSQIYDSYMWWKHSKILSPAKEVIYMPANLPTLCYRRCLLIGCLVFNVAVQQGECRLFDQSHHQLTGEEDPKWQLWLAESGILNCFILLCILA